MKIEMRKEQGFTLIELMIVVAIIGILAAIAIPQYQNYVIRSQVSEGLNLAGGQKTAVTEFYSERHSLPTSNAQAGISPAGSITGKYVSKVRITSNGKIKAYFSNTSPQKANKAISGSSDNVLALSPYTGHKTNTLKWTCSSSATTVKKQYLPSSCRS